MNTRHVDVIYVGFNKQVVAMDRTNGEICWTWKPKGKSGYTTLMLEPQQLIVSINGYMWALDPLTGEELWHNPLKGKGTGVTSMVSQTNPVGHVVTQAAEADAAAALMAATGGSAAAAAAASSV